MKVEIEIEDSVYLNLKRVADALNIEVPIYLSNYLTSIVVLQARYPSVTEEILKGYPEIAQTIHNLTMGLDKREKGGQ